MVQWVVAVADRDDEGQPYTMYVYGPFDEHAHAVSWSKNFPNHYVTINNLIRPTYNAD